VHTWDEEDHREAFEAHMKREGLKVLAELRTNRGYLWNRAELGYGGSGRWPFDVKRAIQQSGYCKGIIRATKNSKYDSVWRDHAKHDLETLVRPVVFQIAEAVDDWDIFIEHGFAETLEK